MRRVRSSVRLKLLVLALMPVAVVLPLAVTGLIAWGASFTYEQLYIKVNTDLAVAHDTVERIKQDRLDQLARLNDSHRFQEAMTERDHAAIAALTVELRDRAGFSFLRVLPAGDKNEHGRMPTVGIEILSNDELHAIDPSLAGFVRLPIVATERARPTERRLEDRGMVIRARHPVLDPAGRVVALLDGGVLLNNNFDFVDAIRDLVYGPGSLPPGSIGTVTVFLDDVRISTNVPRSPGERALGTRVSEEVVRTVLDEGRNWIDRAFVVNDWYISGYEPIVDARGERVGILYAGFLEAPFRAALWEALAITLLVVIVLSALFGVLAVLGAKSIFRPVEQMARVVHATRVGRSSRIGEVDSEDELADLAKEFDAMLDRLEQHAQQMKRWAEELEDKVDERTDALQRRNAELQQTITVLRDTRRKLVTAEKLAALGELTAGVAHEINNPIQVMLGNLDVLTAELGTRLDPVRPEIDLVVEQIYRIQSIVDKLLKYARPDEYTGYLVDLDVNRVVEDVESLVSHLRARHPFQLSLDLRATQPVRINEQELQQVLVNLVTNSVHALPADGGEVRIETADWNRHGVVIRVVDNGSGMDADQCSQAFNPFFSTKREGEGTGLGLPISYGLVRRYGGDITVQSQPGVSTVFEITLLREPEVIDDAERFELEHYAFKESEDPATDTLRRVGGER